MADQQTPLFPDRPHYPDVPGTKSRDDTSLAAAQGATAANSLRKKRCLEEIAKKPGASREIADRLGWNNYTVAPILSQLRALGLIVDSKQRFVTPLGRKSIVWTINTNQKEKL